MTLVSPGWRARRHGICIVAGVTNGPDAVATATTLAFGERGCPHLVVILKATFAFVPDGEMAVVAPEPIVEADFPADPTRSAERTSDLAIHLSRADIVLTGHARAPAGRTARVLTARLAVIGGRRTLLDKTLLVQDPGGFTAMPLVYERAWGGPEVPENPVGTGAVPGSKVPAIYDPHQPQRPAGFGPVRRAWPARARLLGPVPAEWIDSERIEAELPPGFDWDYFQAAPVDQQVEYLHGDEWIVLEGMHPTLAGLRTRLPGVRGAAWIQGASAFGVPDGKRIPLVADTLRIDADAQLCTVVWRGRITLPGEDALAAARVSASVERREGTVAMRPSSPPEPAHTGTTMELTDGDLEPVEERAPPFHVSTGTARLSDEEASGAARSPVLPFPVAGEPARSEPQREPGEEGPPSATSGAEAPEAFSETLMAPVLPSSSPPASPQAGPPVPAWAPAWAPDTSPPPAPAAPKPRPPMGPPAPPPALRGAIYGRFRGGS